jgi:outer membrane protein OmpA-like peptidoglycan-associated protein
VIQRAATQVGESSGATQKALAGIVPTLVGALTQTASTTDGAQQLVRMLDAGKYDGSGLEDLNFETGSTQLTPESGATVNTLVAVLKAYPAVSVALEGHTDSTGDPAANKKLSLDRAGAVKALMVTGGIDEGRISSAGYGQDNPVAPNDTEEGRAKNRRLELVVLKR